METTSTAMEQAAITASPPAGYLSQCECDVILMDGAVGHVRPIRPDDAEALVDFHEHLSSDTVYRRYFSAHPHLRQTEIDRYTRVDYRGRLALILLIDDRLVAVGRYEQRPGSGEAEVAFVVADAFQHIGIGTLLLEHLAAAARRQGIFTFVAETLSWNHPMQEVLRQVGFRCLERWTAEEVDATLALAPTQHYMELLWAREAAAIRSRQRGLAVGAIHAGVGRPSICSVPGRSAEANLERLALLEGTDATEVIIVEVDRLPRPRRFAARVRQAAQRRPIVALLPEPTSTGPTPRCPLGHRRVRLHHQTVRDLWAQVGVPCLGDVVEVTARAEQLLGERRAGSWLPCRTGSMVDLAGCDPFEGRCALDRDPSHLALAEPRRQQLGGVSAGQLLAAYCLPIPGGSGGSDIASELKLTVSDDGAAGLHARLVRASGGGHRAPLRLLPLTDRDAAEMVAAVVPADVNAHRLVDVILRAGRLVDDQPDVRSLEIRVDRTGAAAGGAAVVWVGPGRSSDDDPYVRRLAE